MSYFHHSHAVNTAGDKVEAALSTLVGPNLYVHELCVEDTKCTSGSDAAASNGAGYDDPVDCTTVVSEMLNAVATEVNENALSSVVIGAVVCGVGKAANLYMPSLTSVLTV